jgi:uncharacterized cupredoxin-like copper-binding protein
MRRLAIGSTVVVGAIVAALGAGVAARAASGDDVRTVHVRIHYSTFSPSALRFEPGETVRFVVENTDPIDHEFILGDRTIQIAHEHGTESFHVPRPGIMTVPAGATRITTYTFDVPGALILGCHLPGHFAYGMHIPVTVG